MNDIPFLTTLITRYPDLAPCQPDILRVYQILVDSFRSSGKLLLCGNGGSAADCEHIVGELMKGYLLARPIPASDRGRLVALFPVDGSRLADNLQGALPAISLVSQTSLLSAFSNDVAPDMAFAQQVYGYGRKGDVLLGISTSGRSANVLNALKVARAAGIRTAGLTGASGGPMAELCDACICVPYEVTPEIQERHIAVYHAICAQLEQEFFRS